MIIDLIWTQSEHMEKIEWQTNLISQISNLTFGHNYRVFFIEDNFFLPIAGPKF
jgi:hypothetical protein